jgi:pilus assembly protein FimV
VGAARPRARASLIGNVVHAAPRAGEAPARESKSAASGKITTAVEDKASKEAPKEVLRLSKGEPAGKAGAGKGTARSNAERMRALEEEATAREKALADANDRIAQLEKTIKDMQRLLEVKGQVPPAVPAAKPAPSTAPAAKPEPAPPAKADQVAKADAAKTEAAKIQPGKEAPKTEPAKEAPKTEPAKEAGEDGSRQRGGGTTGSKHPRRKPK